MFVAELNVASIVEPVSATGGIITFDFWRALARVVDNSVRQVRRTAGERMMLMGRDDQTREMMMIDCRT